MNVPTNSSYPPIGAAPFLRAHVPEPPEHDPSTPPDIPPLDDPDKEVDLPPREEPDEIRDPQTPPREEPPMRVAGSFRMH